VLLGTTYFTSVCEVPFHCWRPNNDDIHCFNMNTTTTTNNNILDDYESNGSSGKKRLCKRSPVEELNVLMWEWFQTITNTGVRVSGPMLQEKSQMFAKDLGIPECEFKASKGWLNRFRDRHNITFSTIGGESGSVHRETVAQCLERVPEIVS